MPTRTSGVRDYQRVARAIDYLRRHAGEQPPLAVVARHVHLSEHHFQRMFTRWAGVSPKRFLQFLTVEHAKARLAAQPDVAALADDSGLSGAGRLHDLFVTLEAMSPGEFKTGGAGLAIRYGIHDSPFGPCLIAATPRGICGLHFLDDTRPGTATALLHRQWPYADLTLNTAAVRPLGARLFAPLMAQPDRPLALVVKGTNFQMQVWRALIEVPFGGLTTYRGIARRIGHPAAARAVGNAVASNPIAYLIPCHRLIRETGDFGNYRWGEPRKAAMLGWEAARLNV
ncbi:MAG: methylated-DNA--[protein]-cysteine S-methyltransferase [Betaproteobacteria bacterium]|nr:methylated-DNA--[protein]-cysteine S-methyltransferase [Betaproteobacteria bacterium]